MNEKRILVKDCPFTRLSLNCTQRRCELWNTSKDNCSITMVAHALGSISIKIERFIGMIEKEIIEEGNINNLTGRAPDEKDSKALSRKGNV